MSVVGRGGIGFFLGVLGLLVLEAGTARAQSPASFAQQLAVLKILKPGLTTIGVIQSGLSEKAMQDIRRAGLGQGVKVVIGKASSPGEVGPLYQKLVGEEGAQGIWIPDASDKMLLGIGFTYLREKALSDKVALLVPDESLVQSGAFCSVQSDGQKLTAFVNQRIAEVLGATIPGGGQDISYVTR
jgi:ABC-type uncharacterized transport system substrate-binding protein